MGCYQQILQFLKGRVGIEVAQCVDGRVTGGLGSPGIFRLFHEAVFVGMEFPFAGQFQGSSLNAGVRIVEQGGDRGRGRRPGGKPPQAGCVIQPLDGSDAGSGVQSSQH